MDDGPLILFRGRVAPDWVDYNGHMTESRYLQCFAEATDALLRRIGVDGVYLDSNRSFFTVETHLMHLRQAELDEDIEVATQLLGGDNKRLHLFHRLRRAGDAAVLASAEQMLLHVDTEAGRTAPAEGAVLSAMEALIRAHAGLPRPEGAGRHVGAALR